MEVSKITTELKYIELNGCTLNLEERIQIDLAVESLANDLPKGGSPLYLWGKIRGKLRSNISNELTGTVKDYFIVYSLKESNFQTGELVPAKQFYWCSSTNFIFSSLPAAS
jgi:hypothetical protein